MLFTLAVVSRIRRWSLLRYTTLQPLSVREQNSPIHVELSSFSSLSSKRRNTKAMGYVFIAEMEDI